MGRRLTLILGGARSGKSAYAQKLAAGRGSSILFVATAESADAEMVARIARHRAERPSSWRTLEVPRGAGAAIEAAGVDAEIVLLDCFTALAGNVLTRLPVDAPLLTAETAIVAEVEALLAAYERSRAEWIVVSNEVGLGLVPPYPLGRTFRDALGRAHQCLAAAADEVLFLVCGLPVQIKG
ncbi:MAG: bifunctional adenosylcobinamide kinase/adenosylcobinamide-phosphate guanylyltransferase [Planctomycetes bacterium]|nr:bifunctional adenosylcobinamide kinase/adenosylcobinamide-phosphate guanylyltransferase [Planctomycetota bacterium]